MSENGKELTRRKFLKDAGILAGGTVVAGSFLLAGCKEEVEVTKTVENTVTKTVTDAPSKVTLEVLNPRGEVEPPAVVAPTARLDTLQGKKVALFWNGKGVGNVFWDAMEGILEEQIPNINIVRYEGPFEIGDAMAEQMVTDGVDAVMYGFGD